MRFRSAVQESRSELRACQEESIRIPCAISWPQGGIPRHLETEIHVNHCDLFATLLDAARAAPDNAEAQSIHSPGDSYLAHLRGQASAARTDTVICEYGNARMIRKEGYKLILRYPFEKVSFPNEFYDLRGDPRETLNLYPRPEYEQLIHRLSGELDAYFTTYTVPGHSGLDLANQPMATPASPWIKAVELQKDRQRGTPAVNDSA
jgi:choline-sulfatase